MAVKRKYRLNLRNYGNLPAIMLSQYDEGYALEFEIRDGTEAASDLSAYTVALKGTRADTLAYSFSGTIANNVLTFVIDTTMTACAGRGTAEIAIKDTANDVLFATFNMPVFVERAAVPEGSIDADVERAQEIAEQVQEIVDNAAATVSGEAEKWATGQIDGTDVPSTDPAYENNAKYYAEQAADAAASIGIDATLTQAGKAADAKKTGDEITALKEDFTDIDNLLNGEPSEYIPHTLLLNGSYGSGNTIGNPQGGGPTTRRAYGQSIPFTLLDDTPFVFNSNGTYNIGFVGFNADGICTSTPSTWLSDGSYTKSQVMSNCRGNANTVGFAFQMKLATGATMSDVYADDYCSISSQKYISAAILEDGTIAEEKLSNEVREKLNGESANVVDVIMFMGQSNMAGRGEAANAPTLINGAGYEYRAITAPNTLSPMVEPFGATESNPNGIDEGNAKTGSMAVAFTNAYYTYNGKVPVVGISASKGGTKISEWQSGGAYLTDAISRLTSCVNYLNGAGYTIRHKYILFCLGETDGDQSTTASDFKSLFDTMLATMISQGIEKLFLVRIGNYNYQQSTKYDAIMNCQTEIAQTETDVVMASTDFAGMRARGLMKDAWHYYQEAYNEVGTYSGINVALYEQTGKEPTMYDTKDGTLYYSHKN